MLHLSTEITIINKFRKFLGRTSAETFLKRDYFGSKSPKIANPQTSLFKDFFDTFKLL